MTIKAFAAAGMVALGIPSAASAQEYDGWIETSEYIPSADGTRLAITVRRPTKGGRPAAARLPVIVTQDRSSPPASAAAMRRFTDHGYIWVAQDRRGTGASFGVQTGFVNQFDAQDAKAVIEWSASRPWSSGKVVGTGCSNQGAWQYLVATLRPKGLVAIAPACASPAFFDDAVTMNGVPMFELKHRPFAGECDRPPSGARPAGFVPTPPRPVDADRDGNLLKAAVAGQRCGAAMLGQYWLNMPRDGMNGFAGYRPALRDSALTSWRAVKSSGVAILQLGGWFDAAVAGQLEGHRLWGGRLVMGPWTHGNRAPRDVFPNADVSLDDEMLRWFDRHAKGIRTGGNRGGIRYYTINARAESAWREAAHWPEWPKTRFYLTDMNGLSTGSPPAHARSVEYPQQEVRWFDGRYATLARWWQGDTSASAARSLSHTGAPLAVATELTGTITARLWASADAPDVNVYAMLEDVAPDGTARYVTDGRLRASWRKLDTPSWGKSPRNWHRGFAADIAPLVPGRPAELVFDFFPISYVFHAGHRMRLSIATSIGQAYQAPPLAGGKPVTLALHRDAAHPSAIDLPIKGEPQ